MLQCVVVCVAVCRSVLQCVLQCALQCVASQIECGERDVLIQKAFESSENVAACCSVL